MRREEPGRKMGMQEPTRENRPWLRNSEGLKHLIMTFRFLLGGVMEMIFSPIFPHICFCLGKMCYIQWHCVSDVLGESRKWG